MQDFTLMPDDWFNSKVSLKLPLIVKNIYAYCYLPNILIEHMWRVTSLADKLLNSWTGPKLNQPMLLETMLLHDLGNLVKFDLSPAAPHLLLPAKALTFYHQLQKLWWLKFGQNANMTTSRLIAGFPLKNSSQITKLILGHTSGTLAATVKNHDWLQKICDYTDFRVGPQGLVSLTARFADLKRRYAYKHLDWADEVEVNLRLAAFKSLEAQLQNHLNCNLDRLIDSDLGQINRWQDYMFETN
jgi:hypothetical protein